MTQAHWSELPDTLIMRWASYQCQDGSGHTHAFAGDREEDGVEGTAEGLALAVFNCNESKHQGHGRRHPQSDVDRAYYDAITQLLTHEDDRQYADLRHNMALHEKWGGPPPKVIFRPVPTNPSEWEAIIVDENGDPWLYPARQLDMPDPREIGARKGPGETGWILPKKR